MKQGKPRPGRGRNGQYGQRPGRLCGREASDRTRPQANRDAGRTPGPFSAPRPSGGLSQGDAGIASPHLPIHDEYFSCNGIAIENGILASRELLSLEAPPTAILVSNSKLLLGLLQVLDEKKIKIPAQVSVLSFDDYIWNRYFSPSLTTVAQATNEMGRRSFQLLLQIMNRRAGDDLPEKHVRLPAELRIRTSTAPPRHTAYP